jgi:hypothetical protein
MPDSLLSLVTRGRKSDHIPGERRRDRLRRKFPITADASDLSAAARMREVGNNSGRRASRHHIGIVRSPSASGSQRFQHRFERRDRVGFHRGTGSRPPLLQMYSAKMTGTDCALKRRLPKGKGIAAKESRHGKLSSLHPVEQLLHADCERHAPAAAIGGPALMFRAGPARQHKGRYPDAFTSEAALTFEAPDV